MELKRSRVAPWAAAIAGTAGWAIHHQLLSAVQHFSCGYLGGPTGMGVTVAVLLLIAGGVWLTLAARDPAPGTRRFVANFSLLVAAVFLLPILIQAAATLMLPPCAR